MDAHDLERRVEKLENALSAFSPELRLALGYIQADAAGSLIKSRVVLERLLIQVYCDEMGQEPRKPLLGDMLADNQFTRKLERRILSRMNAIRDMGNLAAHGEPVEPHDAVRGLDDLCEVLDWYVRRCGGPTPAVPPGGAASAVRPAPGGAAPPGGLTPEEAGRLEAVRRLLSAFFRPVHLRLRRDNINWRRILDLAAPEGSLDQGLAATIERDYILPNHEEILGIVERGRHFVESDKELARVLDEYLRHVVVYKAIRSSGDRTTLPLQAGAPWPEAFFPLVEQRLLSLEREEEELRRKQGSPKGSG
jgi:Domain of unknown function (DUF4145)